MNVSRRSLLVGAAGLGVVGVAGRALFPSYESDVWVRNERASPVAVELAVSNLDADETVLDRSLSLAPDESFRRRGVFADDTRYRVGVKTDDQSAEKEFETCCRGFSVGVYVQEDELQVVPAHHD